MDLRDIRTCRRALFVRARLTRSIGPNSANIWEWHLQQPAVIGFGRHGHTKNRTSKGSDNMFCNRPWILRLTLVLLVFARDFDDEAPPEGTAFSSLRRFTMGSVTV